MKKVLILLTLVTLVVSISVVASTSYPRGIVSSESTAHPGLPPSSGSNNAVAASTSPTPARVSSESTAHPGYPPSSGSNNAVAASTSPTPARVSSESTAHPGYPSSSGSNNAVVASTSLTPARVSSESTAHPGLPCHPDFYRVGMQADELICEDVQAANIDWRVGEEVIFDLDVLLAQDTNLEDELDPDVLKIFLWMLEQSDERGMPVSFTTWIVPVSYLVDNAD